VSRKTTVVKTPTETEPETVETNGTVRFAPKERPETTVYSEMQYVGYRIAVIEVTPELALYWVKRHNDHNRHLRPIRRESYARDMLAGDWQFNGDAIRLDELGTILDGQHRLESVIEADRPEVFLVIEGLPRSTQDTMDIGAMRSQADQLGLAGYENPTMLAAVARRLCFVKRPGAVGHGGGRWTPTRAEVRKFVQAEYDNGLQDAVNVAIRASAARIPAAPSVIGGAYFLAAEKDKFGAHLFFVTKLIDQVGLDRDEPAWTLMRRLQKVQHDAGTPMEPELAFRYAILAWNHFRDGTETLERLQKPKNGWPPYSEMVVK
jgi:hypothetical protein